MTELLKRINIICGHYGSGKTNLAVNLAVDLKRQGRDVTLVDLDIVNPYFRSADFTAILKQNGIHTISPTYANTNLDIPALTAGIYGAFENSDSTVIVDVGGDDAGAAAMGRYARMVLDENDYTYLYVVNQYRYLTRSPEEAVQIMREIEQVSRLMVTGIVNNSNLSGETTAELLLASVPYAARVAELAGVPLAANVCERVLAGQAALASLPQAYPVDIFVKPPWEPKTQINLSR